MCESPQLLETLSLTVEQRAKLDSVLDQWKARFLAAKKDYDSQPEGKKRGVYAQYRDRDLQNAVSDLLNDRQHQLFHQILTLWAQSPVQSRHAFEFELGLSAEQHRQLYDLEIEWLRHALERVSCGHRFQRHTEPSVRRIGELQSYRYAVTRLAWQFLPRRNLQWNRILTPEQAKHWKERELERAFQRYQFDLLLADFSVYNEETGQLNTGTWLDHTVPYFTPPFEALNWTEEQIAAINKLPPTGRLQYDDRPLDRQERIRWLEAHLNRSIDCMRQIEQIMTVRQRETWWQGFGKPSPKWNMQLLKMRSNSLLNRPDDRDRTVPGKDPA